MCREVFHKFKACINVDGVMTFRKSRDAIDLCIAASRMTVRKPISAISSSNCTKSSTEPSKPGPRSS